MSLRLIIIRHGESEGNAQNLFRGQMDFPLTQRGVEQAKSLAEELSKRFEIKTIYSSPLQRARETAKIIAEKCNANLIIDESFNNIKLGDWEGKPKNEIAQKYPKEWKIWITEPEKLKLKGAETLDNVQKRAVEAVKRIVNTEKEGDICIVTHRAVIKPLIAGLIGITKPYFWKIHTDTASFSVIEYEKERGFILKLLNYTDHLKEFIEEKV